MEKVVPKIDLLETPPLWRKDYRGIRNYVSLDEDDNVLAGAVSVTAITNLGLPESPGLGDYKYIFGTKHGYKIAMNTMAFYGTVMHIVFGEIVTGIPILMDDGSIRDYFKLNKTEKDIGGLPEYAMVSLPAEINGKRYDEERFRKDAIAMQVITNEMFADGSREIVGIELPLANFSHGFAGCLDLVVRKKTDSGKKYEIYDLKTGSGHYLNHDLQLNMYAVLLAQHLGIDPGDIDTYDIHMKGYKYETLKKYLAGKSKTKPYNLKKVDYDESGWKLVLDMFHFTHTPIDYWSDDFRFTSTPDDALAELAETKKGEDNGEIDD